MSARVSLARCRVSEDGRHSWATCAAERCLRCGDSRWEVRKRLHRMRRAFARTGSFATEDGRD